MAKTFTWQLADGRVMVTGRALFSKRYKFEEGVIVSSWCPSCREQVRIDDFRFKGHLLSYTCRGCEDAESVLRKRDYKPVPTKHTRYIEDRFKRGEDGLILMPCNTCGIDKPLVDFGFLNSSGIPRKGKCKACVNEASRMLYVHTPRKSGTTPNHPWYKKNKNTFKCGVAAVAK